MAAVTRNVARPVMPPGYEDVAGGITNVTEVVIGGDLLQLGATGWAKGTSTGPARQYGFAAQGYKQGQRNCSILLTGEMDGFSGLTPGDPLYPSATAGGLDTTAVAGFTGRIYAVTQTRIRFML